MSNLCYSVLSEQLNFKRLKNQVTFFLKAVISPCTVSFKPGSTFAVILPEYNN